MSTQETKEYVESWLIDYCPPKSHDVINADENILKEFILQDWEKKLIERDNILFSLIVHLPSTIIAVSEIFPPCTVLAKILLEEKFRKHHNIDLEKLETFTCCCCGEKNRAFGKLDPNKRYVCSDCFSEFDGAG